MAYGKCTLPEGCPDQNDCTGRCVAATHSKCCYGACRGNPGCFHGWDKVTNPALDHGDHYICTILPNGRRVQVGAMTLAVARENADHLKAKSNSLNFATWVDWRRLEQWPLLSLAQFRDEVAPGPTLPLGHLSDRILIGELKRRGYLVPKKDHVQNVTCQNPYEAPEFDAMARNPAWMQSAHRALARRLGERLWLAGAFQVSTVESEYGMKALRMNVIAVAPKPR